MKWKCYLQKWKWISSNGPFAPSDRNPFILTTAHNARAVNDDIFSKSGRYVETANTGGAY